jgi:predicted RNase H-like HicB family nuclease
VEALSGGHQYMTKNLAYYKALPYDHEWIPRDDESGRYVVVRITSIPQIYAFGSTETEALEKLEAAFDDHILWCLAEGVSIPEPRSLNSVT